MRFRIFIVVMAIVALALPAMSQASDEGVDVEESGKRCINARAIRRTDVINDNILVFQMLGRRIYLNILPRRCRGLARERRFSFTTHTRSLCAMDRINVLRDSPSGLIEARRCKLGRFHPMTVDELNEFISPVQTPPDTAPAAPPPVEDVVEDEAEESPEY